MRIVIAFVVVVATLALGWTVDARADSVQEVEFVFLVDESFSMSNELAHTWMPDLVAAIEAEAAGRQTAYDLRYALVGFGSPSHAPDNAAHKHDIGGSDWGTADQFMASILPSPSDGGVEDGYQAIDYALSEYAFRPDAAVCLVLITDEDRDVGSLGGAFSFGSVLGQLGGQVSPNVSATLNVIVSTHLRARTGAQALGGAQGYSYVADGLGGYIEDHGSPTIVSAFGQTQAHYIDLAFLSGGSVWDISQVRQGGLVTSSFASAFAEVKLEEITMSPVPEPASVVLLGLALCGLVRVRSRRPRN